MDLGIEGKVAVVTGGSGAIGKAVALELGRNGVDVALIARNQQALDAAAQEIAGETKRKVLGFTADLASAGDIRRVVGEVAQAFGHIDILVNSAARAGGTPIPNPKPDDGDFLDDLTLKTLGYLRMCREVVPHMTKQGWGRVVNIGGGAAYQPTSLNGVAGTIRNAGVAAIAKAVANEFGRAGIGANTVHPSTILTDTVRERMTRAAQAEGISLDAYIKREGAKVPLNRMVTPEDIANIVAFLCSPRSAAVTGESVVASGGSGSVIRY
ncbi:MAG: SDR family oxidoreductase [Dehalococcoidia bacterium]|nr:SDR family oxidoreductase [Dehalococcoidia bacterium]